MRDTHFDPQPSPEEVAEQQRLESQEAELARKIRREVMRVQSGEADEEIEREAEEEAERQRVDQEAKDAAELEARIRRRKQASAFWQLVTGNILVNKGVARYYPHMIGLAVMFFLSIVVMFYSLHLDMRYTHLNREVQLLRERSLRMQSDRYQRSSHSSIIRELQRRGIELQEASNPSTKIE